MAQEMKVETMFKLTIKDAELILTRAELKELKEAIEEILAPSEHEEEDYWDLQDKLDVPPEVPRSLSPFAQAMLAVCLKHHKGHENRARAGEIADEMMKEYPEVTEFYESKARVSFATIFTADNGKGAGLVPAGLLKMKKKNGSRFYWT